MGGWGGLVVAAVGGRESLAKSPILLPPFGHNYAGFLEGKGGLGSTISQNWRRKSRGR